MRAERDRRAAILTAEGVKQSQILTAEGEKQAAVLKAEGAREAAILRAEGEAKAIDTVFRAIHAGDPDPKLLSYQYLQMLPAARPGRGEQDLRHPARVHAGARRHRRRDRGRRGDRRRRRGQPTTTARGRRPTRRPRGTHADADGAPTALAEARARDELPDPADARRRRSSAGCSRRSSLARRSRG